MKSTAQSFKQPQSLLLLGEPGSGKTTLACQLKRPAVLDCDVNLAGPVRWLKDNKRQWQVAYDNPTIEPDGTQTPREKQFPRACAMLNEFAASPDVDTIIVDSLTSFTDIVLTEVRRQQGRGLGKLDFKTPTSKSIDEPFQLQDWGAFFGLMKHIIFQLKASGKMLVVTGHLKTDKDDLSGMLKSFIAVPGQMSDIIAGFFSEVWLIKREMELKGTERIPVRKLITFPNGPQDSSLGLKSSVGIKSGEVLDLDKIIKLINQ